MMLQLCAQPDLLLETLAEPGLFCNLRENHFDRYITYQAWIVGLIDPCHATFTEFGLDEVDTQLSTDQGVVFHLCTPDSLCLPHFQDGLLHIHATLTLFAGPEKVSVAPV